MLTVDAPAVLRAAALLRAFDAGDETHWRQVLTADYQSNPGSAYETFCAMTAFMDRALDWLTHETDHDRDTVVDMFTAAFLDLLDRKDNTDDRNT